MSLLDLVEAADLKAAVQWGTKKYRKGDVIVEENSPGSELFLICKGEVHILSTLQIKDGVLEDKAIARLFEGDFFGEIALFSDDLRSASVVAATDCEIAIINGSLLLAYMDDHPVEGYQIMRFLFATLVDRMRKNNIRANAIMSFYLRESS